MEHLVESHLGGYYVSNNSREIIESYCEQCGDRDYIILSWEKGRKYDALNTYFSKLYYQKYEIEQKLYNDSMSKNDLIEILVFKYDCQRDMIQTLFEEEIISNEEMIKLLKVVSMSQKNQFELLREINIKNSKEKIYKNELARKN